MSRVENLEVFYDTQKMCAESVTLRNNIKASREYTEVITENCTKSPNLNRFDEDANVIVSKKRSLEAASGYKNGKTTVLNFASATNPGGGVTRGSSAQEESICRISTLYNCLNDDECFDKFYIPHREARDPIHNDDIIYTPDVTVFKSDTAIPKVMAKDKWYNVDIITCAAPNLRDNPSNPNIPDEKGKAVSISDEKLLKIHEKRLKKILDVAVEKETDNIILGAFGCGAFKNNPEVVAQAASNVLKDYIHSFKNIEFAIYDKGECENFKAFNNILNK